jgi:hypothetical protein
MARMHAQEERGESFIATNDPGFFEGKTIGAKLLKLLGQLFCY